MLSNILSIIFFCFILVLFVFFSYQSALKTFCSSKHNNDQSLPILNFCAVQTMCTGKYVIEAGKKEEYLFNSVIRFLVHSHLLPFSRVERKHVAEEILLLIITKKKEGSQ